MQMDLQFRSNQLVFFAVLISVGLHGLLLPILLDPMKVQGTNHNASLPSLTVEIASINDAKPAPSKKDTAHKATVKKNVSPNTIIAPNNPPVPSPDTSASDVMNAPEEPVHKSTVGLKFRPELKRRMEETRVLREKWEGNDDPLEQKGGSLLWRKNGCFEITDNEGGNGQTFQFSSKCSSTQTETIDLNSLIKAIKPTYGSFSNAENP